MTSFVLQWQGLTVRDEYGSLHGPVNLELSSGKGVVVTGSRAGLEALLAVSMAQKPPEKGEILWWGEVGPVAELWDICRFKRKIGLIYDRSQLVSGLSLIENVCLDLEYNQGLSTDLASQKADLWLARLGLEKLRDRSAERIGEGLRHLACCAVTLCRDPILFLLERPHHYLDEHWPLVLAMLRKECSRGMSFVVFDRSYGSYKSEGLDQIALPFLEGRQT